MGSDAMLCSSGTGGPAPRGVPLALPLPPAPPRESSRWWPVSSSTENLAAAGEGWRRVSARARECERNPRWEGVRARRVTPTCHLGPPAGLATREPLALVSAFRGTPIQTPPLTCTAGRYP